MRRAALLAALVLAGCGIDGPPVTPDPAPEEEQATASSSRIVITGSASAGVSGGGAR